MDTVQHALPETPASGLFPHLTIDEQISALRRTLDGIDDQRRRVAESITILEAWQAEQSATALAEVSL